MEKVFASVRSPLEISVAVARTSQSPFPLAEMFNKTAQIKEIYDKKNLDFYFNNYYSYNF